MKVLDLNVNGSVALDSNLGMLSSYLDDKLEAYHSLVVTEDTLKSAKQDMADINKAKNAISDAWKLKKRELEAPIKEFEVRLKEVLSKCDNARASIASQVESFESGQRELAQQVCEIYKNQVCNSKGIDGSLVSVEGFDNLTYLTNTGKISSIAKQKIDNLVLEKVNELAMQKAEEAQKILEQERIKQEAIAQYEAQKQMQKEQQPTPAQSTYNEQSEQEAVEPDKSQYIVEVVFKVKASKDASEKVKAWFESEVKKNPALAKALSLIQVSERC